VVLKSYGLPIDFRVFIEKLAQAFIKEIFVQEIAIASIPRTGKWKYFRIST